VFKQFAIRAARFNRGFRGEDDQLVVAQIAKRLKTWDNFRTRVDARGLTNGFLKDLEYIQI